MTSSCAAKNKIIIFIIIYLQPFYFNAIDLIGSADNLLVAGTSFYTSTANDLVDRARMAGIKVKIINENAEKEVPKFLAKFFCAGTSE